MDQMSSSTKGGPYSYFVENSVQIKAGDLILGIDICGRPSSFTLIISRAHELDESDS